MVWKSSPATIASLAQKTIRVHVLDVANVNKALSVMLVSGKAMRKWRAAHVVMQSLPA